MYLAAHSAPVLLTDLIHAQDWCAVCVVFVVFVIYGYCTRKREPSGSLALFRHLLARLKGRSVFKTCPECGSATSTKVKHGENEIVLVADRVCSACGTRYSPPTPRIVAILAMAGGIAVIVTAIYLVFAASHFGILADERIIMRLFVPWFALLGSLTGIYLILLGVVEFRYCSSAASDEGNQTSEVSQQ